MAVFGGLVLTNLGRNLEAKHISGKELKFKKVVLGDGNIGNSESMITLTGLKNEVLSLGIKKIEVVQENIVKITFMLSNIEIPEGFFWREIGVIAEDPDTNAEILYCYGNARENGEYISAGGETDVLEKYVNIDLVVSNTENISATLDRSLIYITQKELEKELNSRDIEIKDLEKTQIIISEEEPQKECLWNKIIGNVSEAVSGDTEYDVSIAKREKDGTKIPLFPITKVKNVLDKDRVPVELPIYKTITLEVAKWNENSDTKEYEYTIQNDTITSNHRIEGSMNLENQEKMYDGYISSFEGGFKIITSEPPLENITMDISIIKHYGGDIE